jgi:tetratricopeptide (TPR) repeat protein
MTKATLGIDPAQTGGSMMSRGIPCGAALAGLLLLYIGRAEAGDKWLTRLDEAERLAVKDGKDLFVLFTGTAWCGPCIQFESNVLSRPEFVRWLDTEVFRARLLAKLGRHAEAIAVFDSASNVKSLTTLNRANLLAEKVMVLNKAGRHNEALACAEQT